jgi:integrase
MPNGRVTLTESICLEALPEEREYALRDIRQPGLILRVLPSGTRSWIVRLRVNGIQQKRRLGAFPDISLKAARRAAGKALMDDPFASMVWTSAPSFEDFQAEHEQLCERTYKPSGLRTYRNYVNAQLLPAFGNTPVHLITRPMIIWWFERYSRNSPGGANRSLGILSHMLNIAKSWGYMPENWSNPASSVKYNRRKAVGVVLSEEQLRRLGEVLSDRIDAGKIAAALLWFLALTGCRVGEAIDLSWASVLPDRLQLPDSKTGPRQVPLGTTVVRFLDDWRQRSSGTEGASGDAAVFPLTMKYRYNHIRALWVEARKQAGLPDTVRIHDLRHSFASHAIMSGETLFVTSRLLGHRRIQTTARYAHLGDDTLLDAAERIGELIMRQVTG